jgi:hypothetical protein
MATTDASVPTHLHGGRVFTHCAFAEGSEIDHMREHSPAIRLAWMEQDASTGRINLSWQAQQDDGSWKRETATVEAEESHPLLELCREAAAEFARRERGT